MKKFAFAMVALLATNTLFGKSLSVSVSEDENNNGIRISFQTVERMSSICHMTVNRLVLDYGVTLNSRRPVYSGKIRFSAATDLMSMCLRAFGPHRGSLALNRGSSLPSLRKGRYALTINGESYGVLVVEAGAVRLESAE